MARLPCRLTGCLAAVLPGNSTLERGSTIRRSLLDGDLFDQIALPLQRLDDRILAFGKLAIRFDGLDLEFDNELITGQAQNRIDGSKFRRAQLNGQRVEWRAGADGGRSRERLATA